MTMRVHEGASLEVTIEGFDDEGRGRATLVDVDVAVRGALPGDVVRCTVDRVWPARSLAQARVVDVIARGPLHVARSCPHPGPCPGCPLEGVDAGFALDLKRARVVSAFADVGLDVSVDDVVPSRAPRQKVKLTAGGSPGALRLGLFVPHSHVLVGAEECPHVHPAIDDALAVLGEALDDTGLPPATRDPRGVKAVIARAFQGPTDVVVGAVIVTGAPLSGEEWRTLGACVDGAPLVALAIRVDAAQGNSLVGGEIVRFVGPQLLTPLEGGPDASVDAFCQTDPELSVAIYESSARFLVKNDARGNATFIDAYAGAGGFSRALLAAGGSSVIAIERAPEGVRTLRSLAVEVIASSVEDALPSLAGRAFAGVVVDPPKSGLKDAAVPLAALGAPRVVLVACDPDAGARDTKVFVDAGYRVVSVVPYDLFPATPEVETVIFLER